MIEDRWQAIRWAIGSAQTDDCVVIVGRGHKDHVDWRFGDQYARVSAVFVRACRNVDAREGT